MDREAPTCLDTVYPLIVQRVHQTKKGSPSTQAEAQGESNRPFDSPSGPLEWKNIFRGQNWRWVQVGVGPLFS